MIPNPDPGLTRAFGRFAARTLPQRADVLVGWSAGILEAIAPAQMMDAARAIQFIRHNAKEWNVDSLEIHANVTDAVHRIYGAFADQHYTILGPFRRFMTQYQRLTDLHNGLQGGAF